MQKYYDKTPTQGSTNPVTSDALNTQLTQIGLNLGNLANLQTTDKSSLVAAINEVKNNANTTAQNTSYTDNYGIDADNVQDAIDTAAIVNRANVVIDLTQYEAVRAYINGENKWLITNNTVPYYGMFIPVEAGKRYKITACADYTSTYAFLTSNTPGSNNSTVSTYAEGAGREIIAIGATVFDTAPADAKYMWVGTYTTRDVKPQGIEQDNKITAADAILNADTTPTEGSIELVKSGGVYEQLLVGSGSSAIDLSEYPVVRAFPTNNDLWAVNYQQYKGIFIPIEAGLKYGITANSSGAAYFCFLTNGEYVNAQPVSYATGSERTLVPEGTSMDAIAPDDAEFLYVATYTTSDRTPESVIRYNARPVKKAFADMETSPVKDSMELITSGAVYDVSQRAGYDGVVSLYGLETTEFYTINGSNKWVDNSAAGLNALLFPLTDVKVVSLSLTGSVNSIYAFLASKRTEGSDVVDFAEGYDSRITLVAGTSTGNLEVPSDAEYLYIYNIAVVGDITGNITLTAMAGALGIAKYALMKADSGTGASVSGKGLLNAAMTIGNPLQPLEYTLDSNGWMLPQTREHLNAIKKARQMQTIVWTPKASIPKNTSGTFAAGTPVTGLIYSSTKEIDKYIGYDVSIHTFMTAVNNPYSLLYTEDISAAHSTSAWGKTYHGVNCRAYFGTVCSTLTGVSVGQTVQWPSAENKWMADYRCMLTKNFDQSAQGLMIGDIYWMQGHNRLVTGVKRNTDGAVTNVEVTESDGLKVNIHTYTATALDNKTRTEGGIFYRNLELYKDRYYEPSEYVAVWDEAAVSPVYNNDICTFAGDMATFREGDTIVIDYNLDTVGSWTAMEIYKNDVLLDTVSISTSAHYVNLTSRNLAYGKYKARMSDGNGGYSDYTYWEVLQANVTVTANDEGTHTMAWTSANGKALSYTVCDITGVVYAHDEITDDDRDAGTLTVDLYRQNREQYASTPFTSGMYLKIHFEGDYGRVTNTPLVIAL